MEARRAGERRLLLRVAVKLLAGTALLAAGYVLFSSTLHHPSRSAMEVFTVELGDLAPGAFKRVDWKGRQVLILHRTAAMVAALKAANPNLRDPDSTASTQPAQASNPFRSLRPEYLVVLAYGTDLGCPLKWVRPTVPAPVVPWHGGFRDSCRGSWYDLAGRVYRGQAAERNLAVPPYRIEGTVLRLGDGV